MSRRPDTKRLSYETAKRLSRIVVTADCIRTPIHFLKKLACTVVVVCVAVVLVTLKILQHANIESPAPPGMCHDGKD